MHKGAAVLSATGPQIQDVIRALQDVQVMFDDHHGVALLQQCVEGPKQFGDVVHVQTCGGFVKHKKGVALPIPTGKKSRQFDALRFAATQRVGALAERDVAEPHILQGLELGQQASNGGWRLATGLRSEKEKGIVHSHREDVVYVLALVRDFEDVVLKALAPAVFADELQVCHELHAHSDVPFAFAGFTASP